MSMTEFCCDFMEIDLTHTCDIHLDPLECPDRLIYVSEDMNEFGLLLHHHKSQYDPITFCPWCGTKLGRQSVESNTG